MEKTRQWLVLTAMGALAIVVGGWFIVASPQHKHAADLRSQADGVVSSNGTLQVQLHQLQAQQAGVSAQQRKLATFARRIPDNPALPALIRQLSIAAQAAGVDLVSLSPSAPSVVAASTAARAGATLPPTAASGATASTLLQIPIAVQVTGSYFNVESFFNAIEGLTRVMMVSSFTMTPVTGPASGAAATTSTTSAPATVPNSVTTQITGAVFESPAVVPVTPISVSAGATKPTTSGTSQTTSPVTSSSNAPSSSSSGQ